MAKRFFSVHLSHSLLLKTESEVAGFYVRNHFPVPSWENVEEDYDFEVITLSGGSLIDHPVAGSHSHYPWKDHLPAFQP